MLSPAVRCTGEGGMRPEQSAHIGSPELPYHTQPLATAPIATDPSVSDTTPCGCTISPHTAPLSHCRRMGGHLSPSWHKVQWGGMSPQSPLGHCTPGGNPGLNPPASLLSVDCKGLQGPVPHSLGEGRLVPGVCPWEVEVTWIAQGQRPPVGVRAGGVAPGPPVPPLALS